jgi:hypothetical protein
MYTEENYFWGLVAYSLAVLCLLPLMYQFSRLLYWRFLKWLFWLVSLVILLTPVRAYPDMHFLAPAWLVAAFEFVRPASPEGPARAITPVVVGVAAVFLLWIAMLVMLLIWRRKRAASSE